MKRLILPLLVVGPALAQGRVLTVDDYARAEARLAATTDPLVTGLGVRPTWLPDGRFWYRTTTARGAEFFMVDPAKKSKAPAFDHARLAAAIGNTTSSPVTAYDLPFQSFELAADGKSIAVTSRQRRLRCDITAYTCANDAARAVTSPPRNSVTSPDGRKAAYIKDYNLWVRDLAAGTDKQLTTDGVKDFGYATNNAGWTRSDNPVLT